MTKSGDLKAIDLMTRILCDSILRGCAVCLHLRELLSSMQKKAHRERDQENGSQQGSCEGHLEIRVTDYI